MFEIVGTVIAHSVTAKHAQIFHVRLSWHLIWHNCAFTLLTLAIPISSPSPTFPILLSFSLSFFTLSSHSFVFLFPSFYPLFVSPSSTPCSTFCLYPYHILPYFYPYSVIYLIVFLSYTLYSHPLPVSSFLYSNRLYCCLFLHLLLLFQARYTFYLYFLTILPPSFPYPAGFPFDPLLAPSHLFFSLLLC